MNKRQQANINIGRAILRRLDTHRSVTAAMSQAISAADTAGAIGIVSVRQRRPQVTSMVVIGVG